MIRNITFLAATVLALSVSAQADKIKLKARVSPSPELADKSIPKSVVSGDGRTLIVLKDRDPQLGEKDLAKAKPMLEQYDLAKLGLMRTMEPSEKLGKQKVILEEMVIYQNSPVLFGTIRDLRNGNVSIVSTKVDHNLTKPSMPYEEVVAFKASVSGDQVAMGRAPGRQGPAFIASPNGNSMLIVSPEVRDTIAGKACYLLATVDNTMKVIWQHVVDVEQGLAGSDLVDAELDDEGNAWLLIRYDHKGKSAAKGEIEREVKLFHAGESGVNGVRFGLGDKQYVTSAMFDRAGKGSIVVAGMAGTTADGVKPEFVFTGKMPSSLTDITSPVILRDPFAGASSTTSGPKTIRDIHVGSGGDVVLVFEEYEYASIPHPKTLVRSMKHVHGSVHAISIGRSGEANWTSTVRRLVQADNKYLGNVHSVLFNDQLQLFMIDSEGLQAKRNATDKEITAADLKDPRTVHFMFDPNGGFKTKTLLEDIPSELIAGEKLVPIGTDRYIGFATSRMEGAGYLPLSLEFTR